MIKQSESSNTASPQSKEWTEDLLKGNGFLEDAGRGVVNGVAVLGVSQAYSFSFPLGSSMTVLSGCWRLKEETFPIAIILFLEGGGKINETHTH